MSDPMHPWNSPGGEAPRQGAPSPSWQAQGTAGQQGLSQEAMRHQAAQPQPPAVSGASAPGGFPQGQEASVPGAAPYGQPQSPAVSGASAPGGFTQGQEASVPGAAPYGQPQSPAAPGAPQWSSAPSGYGSAPSFSGGSGFPPPGVPAQQAKPPRGPVKRWAVILSAIAGCLVVLLAITAVVMSSVPARAERVPEVTRSNLAEEGYTHSEPIPFARVALREMPAVVLSADGWSPGGNLPLSDAEGYSAIWTYGDDENCYVAARIEGELPTSNIEDRAASDAYAESIMKKAQGALEPPVSREQTIVGGGSLEMLSFRIKDLEGLNTMVSLRVFAGSGHALVFIGSCEDGSDPSARVREFQEQVDLTVMPT